MQYVPREQNDEKKTTTRPWYSSMCHGTFPQGWSLWPHLSPLHSQIPSSGKICFSDYNSDSQEAGEGKIQKGSDALGGGTRSTESISEKQPMMQGLERLR